MSTVSAVTCEVIVRRTTVFFMLNYIMVWIPSPDPSHIRKRTVNTEKATIGMWRVWLWKCVLYERR